MKRRFFSLYTAGLGALSYAFSLAGQYFGIGGLTIISLAFAAGAIWAGLVWALSSSAKRDET